MYGPQQLLANNKQWAQRRLADDPAFFEHLSQLKSPKYMWIGCSDSRVPANEIIGLEPGQVFVHRNVANQVHHTDLNVLAAVQFAVESLGVEHIIVTGHYDCGGVRAAMGTQHHGMVDNWIRGIRDTYVSNTDVLKTLDHEQRCDALCELNVKRQVENLCHTRIVQNAWADGRKLSVHGWVYRLKDGVLHDLNVSQDSAEQSHPVYRVR